MNANSSCSPYMNASNPTDPTWTHITLADPAWTKSSFLTLRECKQPLLNVLERKQPLVTDLESSYTKMSHKVQFFRHNFSNCMCHWTQGRLSCSHLTLMISLLQPPVRESKLQLSTLPDMQRTSRTGRKKKSASVSSRVHRYRFHSPNLKVKPPLSISCKSVVISSWREPYCSRSQLWSTSLQPPLWGKHS